jgi:hypothetical protein
MSLLYTLVGPVHVIMSADSRSTVTSFELDGEKYRYQDNYKKLVRSGNFVVAGSGQNTFGGECLETAVPECEGNSLKSFALNLCLRIQPHVNPPRPNVPFGRGFRPF